MIIIAKLYTMTVAEFDPNLGSLKPNFGVLAKFGFLLNLVWSNLDRSRSQLSNDTKIIKFGQILVHQNFQNSYIANFAGF